MKKYIFSLSAVVLAISHAKDQDLLLEYRLLHPQNLHAAGPEPQVFEETLH